MIQTSRRFRQDYRATSDCFRCSWSRPGSVIGSGWLLGALNASKVAGPAAIISWIVGVILLIGIALIYAELGSTYPISGSTARFTWIHAGTLGGFFAGTYSYLQASPSRRSRSRPRWATSTPSVSLGPGERQTGLLTGKGPVRRRAGFMFVFMAINLLGMKWMAQGNTIAMIVEDRRAGPDHHLHHHQVLPQLELHRRRRVHAVRHQGRVHRAAAGRRSSPWKASSRPPSSPARRATPGGTCRSPWSARC